MGNKIKKYQGFTIIELLCAIALLAIVIAFSASAYVKIYNDNTDNIQNVTLINIRQSLNAYVELSAFAEIKTFIINDKKIYYSQNLNTSATSNFSQKEKTDSKYYVKFSGGTSSNSIIKITCYVYFSASNQLIDKFMIVKSR